MEVPLLTAPPLKNALLAVSSMPACRLYTVQLTVIA